MMGSVGAAELCLMLFPADNPEGVFVDVGHWTTPIFLYNLPQDLADDVKQLLAEAGVEGIRRY